MRSFLIVTVMSVMGVVGAQAQAREPEPAFPGQTEAPPPARASSEFNVDTIATGLDGAWSLAFLPDGNFLISQNVGTMRIITPEGVVSDPITGVPPVKSVAAQGLHDVVLDPDFEENRLVYFTYFAPPKGEAAATWPIEHFYEEVWSLPLSVRRTRDMGTERLSRGRLSEDNRRLEDVEILIDGGTERRIVFAPDGTVYGIGADRFRFYDSDLDGVERVFTDNPDLRRNFTGRVIRINPDGSIPLGNPWLGRATVFPETFAHGLKDPEGAALHPETGELWVIDHGPQGGDEINVIRAGRDYGWPEVSYGVQYDDRQLDGRTNVRVGSGEAHRADVQEPVYYWIPSIAPSGMMFYTGDLFPEWQGNLFVGAMVGQHLVRLVLDGERVVAEEQLLGDLGQRIREVQQGPDGAVYVFLGNSLLRLTP
jgi:glucose/arabinose dehydrogenase